MGVWVRSYSTFERVKWRGQLRANPPFALKTLYCEVRWNRGAFAIWWSHGLISDTSGSRTGWQYAHYHPRPDIRMSQQPGYDRLNVSLGNFQLDHVVYPIRPI